MSEWITALATIALVCVTCKYVKLTAELSRTAIRPIIVPTFGTATAESGKALVVKLENSGQGPGIITDISLTWGHAMCPLGDPPAHFEINLNETVKQNNSIKIYICGSNHLDLSSLFEENSVIYYKTDSYDEAFAWDYAPIQYDIHYTDITGYKYTYPSKQKFWEQLKTD